MGFKKKGARRCLSDIMRSDKSPEGGYRWDRGEVLDDIHRHADQLGAIDRRDGFREAQLSLDTLETSVQIRVHKETISDVIASSGEIFFKTVAFLCPATQPFGRDESSQLDKAAVYQRANARC